MFVFDLINFVLGAVAGGVVTVLVPKVFAAISGEVKVVETAAKGAAASVAATAAAVSNTANTKL